MKVGLIPFIFFLFTTTASMGQISVVEGSLTDSETGAPVPYASISLVGTAVGTSSNGDGSFTLKIPEQFAFKKITIKITCVGYENYLIDKATGRVDIRLKPSKTILKEIVVSSADLTPDRIVKIAFDRVRKNYDTRPFVYQTFYRHYCKDDDQYGRLIEAAVDIYKRKGYRTFQHAPGAKDEVRVMQLRRSFDNTKVMINHAPIALYTIMTADEVAYQSRGERSDVYWAGSMSFREMSTLQKYPDQYDFSMEYTTTFDNEEVYKISYRMREDAQKLQAGKGITFKGILYINTRNFAFVKTESQRHTPFDTVRTSSSYRLNGNKYYLFHSLREGNGINKQLNIRHQYHIELTTTKILTQHHPVFKGKEPGKEILFNVPYDSTFWDDYNIIKATPLEEKIVADLEQSASLKNQFSNYSEVEMERFFSGKEDEERFNQFLKFSQGRVMYISFWKSDCGACLRELEYSRKLLDKYKLRVAFVYLSLDGDLQLWKAALKKHKLTSVYANHFRIGPDADAIRLFEVNETPRYVLVNKNGFFADQNARRPTDPDLEKDIERLLAEKVDKP